MAEVTTPPKEEEEKNLKASKPDFSPYGEASTTPIPNLYLGSVSSALDLKWQEDKKVALVLSVGKVIKSKKFSADHLVLDVNDNEDEKISRHFPLAHTTLDKYLSEGKVVLVHCMAGVSRSATIVLSYLIRNGSTFEKALNHLRTYRPCVGPNRGFCDQLVRYEKELLKEKESTETD